MAEVGAAAWRELGTRVPVGDEEVFVVDVAAAREEAPPVLVLHGYPTSGHDWAAVLDRMRARRRVVVPDLPGYGLSTKSDRPYSLFGQADVVEAVAAGRGLDEVALVTHDMGDSVGGELLARDLDGALGFTIERRVVTNGSIYLPLAQLTDGQQMLRSLPDALIDAELAPTAEMLAVALRATFAPDADVDDDLVAEMAELVAHDGGTRLLARLIRYVDERAEHEARWTGAIESHPSPLAVVWGELDPIAVLAMAHRLGEARPDATVTTLAGVGHYPMVEAPGPFGDALVAALDG